jgi:hypothetical protein
MKDSELRWIKDKFSKSVTSRTDMAFLIKELEELRKAVRPFAHPDLFAMRSGNKDGGDSIVFQRDNAVLKARDFKRVQELLEEDTEFSRD